MVRLAEVLDERDRSRGFIIAPLTHRISAGILDILFLGGSLFMVMYAFLNEPLVWWAVFFILCFYHLVGEMLMNGQSPGKKIMGLRVVKLDDTNASFAEYAIRWVFRILDITMTAGVLAVIVIATNKKGQRLGDIMAGTKVIILRSVSKGLQATASEIPQEVSSVINNRPLVFQFETKNGTLRLYDNHLRYRTQALIYRDLTGISFYNAAEKQISKFLPIFDSTLYRIRFVTPVEECVVEFYPFESLTPNQSQRELDERLVSLYQRLHQLVKPYVVFNLLLQYHDNKKLSISDVEISSSGISTRNLWGLSNKVSWEEYDSADMKDGNLHLYKHGDDAQHVEFFYCSTDKINTFALPDVLHFLQPLKGIIDFGTRERIAARLKELL